MPGLVAVGALLMAAAIWSLIAEGDVRPLIGLPVALLLWFWLIGGLTRRRGDAAARSITDS